MAVDPTCNQQQLQQPIYNYSNNPMSSNQFVYNGNIFQPNHSSNIPHQTTFVRFLPHNNREEPATQNYLSNHNLNQLQKTIKEYQLWFHCVQLMYFIYYLSLYATYFFSHVYTVYSFSTVQHVHVDMYTFLWLTICLQLHYYMCGKLYLFIICSRTFTTYCLL
jgi:hypothetical protein